MWATAAFTSSAEQDQIVYPDLGHVFLLAAGLIVPGVGLQAPFDIDLTALLQILACNFGGARPGGNVVPLSSVLPVAFFVFESVVCGQAELCYGVALGSVINFWILAEATEKNDLDRKSTRLKSSHQII